MSSTSPEGTTVTTLGLPGKRAIVSGAGYIRERAGHGYFTARSLAAAGASVACVDIDAGRAAEVASHIAEAGGKAVAIVADMTDRAEVGRAIGEARDHLGGIDICADIIGGALWDEALDVDDRHWDWVIRNNLTQVFLLYQAASRIMIEQGTGGSIVALSSVEGLAASAYHAPYGAAKAGVIALTKTFAHELGRYGIRVNSVAPGNVGAGNLDQPPDEFPVNPINPLAAPRSTDIADAVLFLSSPLASRITGQTLVVDGGATVRELWGLTPDIIPAFKTMHYGQR
jgi:3-oxoacyl-[acyl-carrier protein] reductase